MIVIRRRFLFWLLRAYIKRWGKSILFFFFFGLVIFFVLRETTDLFARFTPKEKVGVAGVFTTETLPPFILGQLSTGLTKVSDNGEIVPDAAKEWKVDESGKIYTFSLKEGLEFTDGDDLTPENINFPYSDVSLEKPDRKTLIFKLKEPFAPFLVTASRPLFKENLKGLGPYEVKNIDLNGEFVESIRIARKDDQTESITYQFYPTQEAVKIAFSLGEVSKVVGLTNDLVKEKPLSKYPGVKSERLVNHERLVTIFYNNNDSFLSNSRLRDALSYALPDIFPQGERALSPISPKSWAYNQGVTPRLQDLEHARLLFSEAEKEIGEKPTLSIKTLDKYKDSAELIAKSWAELGIKSEIEVVGAVPSNYQIFLGDFRVSRDPDQYSLWHSGQPNNITNYKSLRIDKLLEDGRKTTDRDERKKIYGDFQKYLLDDSPASFLYFPYEYTIWR